MESLEWVDSTYIAKHRSEDPKGLRAMYYPNLRMYGSQKELQRTTQKSPIEAVVTLLKRSGKRAAISLAVYMLSFLPVVGKFVLPAASFYTFRKAVGVQPAVAIFATGIFLPKRYLVMFLQTYFSSRTLMRELVCLHCTVPTLANQPSSFHTSTVFRSQPLKRSVGSTIAPVYCLASPLPLWYSLRFRLLACSSTVLPKRLQPISSPRSLTRLHRHRIARRNLG